MTITEIRSLDDPRVLAGLWALLEDSVNGGASVGFHPPLGAPANAAYWAGVAEQVKSGATVLLAAGNDDGELVGTVQLALCPKQNGPHRAEVQKLLVHSAHRRRGLGRRLLAAAEERARALGRTLLVLDTLEGREAVPLYLGAGWIEVGRIPGYTVEADGSRHATVVFYKPL
ncbi:GNAT family N-acetyltransferase [Azospirillum sp.]|uniref:GNAT family N-acetyltransferase n=1 Tax=Azospirillum sp. TaxID=34012 RepID=UPI003D74264A